MIQGASILITGGAGFIGTALCRRLSEKNQVRVLDNLKRDALSKASLEKVQLQVGDVRDYDAVSRAVDGVDHIIHLASIAGVDTVLKDPVTTMEVSLEGTANLLKAAHKQGNIKRLIDFSTSEVFGSYAFRASEQDVTKLGAVGEARWTYAVSKLATEHLAHNYWKQYGLAACSVRPFNIYGPGQIGEGAVHAFVWRALQGMPIQIHNHGDQIRSWCYIDDIVDGTLLALQKPEAVGQAFNIGNPRSTITIYQLAKLIVRLADSKSDIQFVRWDHPDVELRIPNTNKAEQLLGFEAKVDLEDGLLRTIDWYRKSLPR